MVDLDSEEFEVEFEGLLGGGRKAGLKGKKGGEEDGRERRVVVGGQEKGEERMNEGGLGGKVGMVLREEVVLGGSEDQREDVVGGGVG